MPSDELIDDRHAVDVWLVAPGASPDSGSERWSAVLAAPERQRASRLLDPEHRARFVFAHGLKREILARYTGERPQDLRFTAGVRGKPVLVPADPSAHVPPAHFNMSHTRDLVALAVCRTVPIGIDVEAIRPVSPGLARRFFSAREAVALEALTGDARQRAFFRVWTAKEAVTKALGTGIAHGLDRFAVTVAHDAPLALEWMEGDATAPMTWTLHALPVPPDFAGALAIPVRSEAACVQFRTL
ncbi:MAG: 4'-phosphopantetheinyl transferase superfamily protein [Hyphomicrobiaceae bacterium]|nr:4'-phosphopantetheinyl transferase superfamily protein [Hyphomicrobiaceae bacterium]